MATLSAEAKQLLQRVKDDAIQYIKLEICDSYCRSLGKLVPASDLKQYLQNGYMSTPHWLMTVNQMNCVIDSTYPTTNIKCILDIDTYKKLPPSLCLKTYNKQTTKMARIVYRPINKTFASVDPRAICNNILSKLYTEFGYSVYSAFEHEFQLFKPSQSNNKEWIPCWDGAPFCNNLELLSNGYGPFMVECERTLRLMDVDVECMHLEASKGQYEWTMKPSIGIQSADNSFVYKQTIKQIATTNGLRAVFATTPECDKTKYNSNGAHFNHSLWNKDGQSIFFDATQMNGLSVLGQYWIGGILKHLKGITVFAVPTVNCFRRVNNKHNWSPTNGSWGFGNRLCTIRVKRVFDTNNRINGCYIEYRLPCSASNPYYVMSSVLLAGMDGIRNKILPKYAPFGDNEGDPTYDERFEKIPQSLEIALDEWKKDDVICNGFGAFFVEKYCKVKMMEIDYVQQYTKEFGDRNKAERFLFSKL